MNKNLLLFFAVSLFSISPIGAAERDTNSVRHSCCVTSEPQKAELTDKSLYQLDASWTSDGGQPFKLGALKGRPQVLTMFFANCSYACPLLVYQMKQLEAALPENLRTNVGFTLVSFDTERDTPAALRKYRTEHELSPTRWNLLRGNEDHVLELAALLGVKFTKDARGQFIHSNVITVLNADGEIIYQQNGLKPDTEELTRQLEHILGR